MNDLILVSKLPATERGFTLIELLVTLSIVAILAALALPNFMNFFSDTRASTQSSDLMADLAYARGEAIKRGMTIVVCPVKLKVGPLACSENQKDWINGHLIMVQDDDETLRVSPPLARNTEITRKDELEEGPVEGTGPIKFYPSGAVSVPASFSLCHPGRAKRVIKIKNSGATQIVRTEELCPAKA